MPDMHPEADHVPPTRKILHLNYANHSYLAVHSNKHRVLGSNRHQVQRNTRKQINVLCPRTVAGKFIRPAIPSPCNFASSNGTEAPLCGISALRIHLDLAPFILPILGLSSCSSIPRGCTEPLDLIPTCMLPDIYSHRTNSPKKQRACQDSNIGNGTRHSLLNRTHARWRSATPFFRQCTRIT